jgi:glutamate synthase (NADPH/NADH) large chain
MTAGRAVVLGDPGPWFCAGQTGGRVYLRVNPDWGLDRAALVRRRGKGAKVALRELDAEGVLDVQELVAAYAAELRATAQEEEAERVLALTADPAAHFLMSVPEAEQTDPSISTE